MSSVPSASPGSGPVPGGLPYAYGRPTHSGVLRASPDDFRVDEILSFTPNGSGEHVFLRIEKTGDNTEYVARRLARFAAVPVSAIGYAGLKDRHGRTSQWFSVSLPGRPVPDWSAFETETVRILTTTRNQRKLRRGAVAANRFEITVRSVTADPDALDDRLARIASGGVPNYFGPQRFGHDGGNVTAAVRMLAPGCDARRVSRHQRSLYLSAARAYLFNRMLGERVASGTWNRAIPGDVYMFSTGHSLFHGEATNPDIIERIGRGEIHAAGTLWGSGERLVADQALAIEDRALSDQCDLCRGLEQAGLRAAMRPLRVRPSELAWQLDPAATLALRFTLPPGAYATTVLREILDTGDAMLPEPDDGEASPADR